MRFKLFFPGLLILALLIGACSANNPVVDDDMMPSQEHPTGNVAIAETGTIFIDENFDVRIERDRTLDVHYNITGLLAAGCPGGCFQFRILSVDGIVLTVELSIENPTSIQVWDVRLLYLDTAGKTVLNPDGYVDQFGFAFKPFTAFAKEHDRRAFPVGPGAVDTEILYLEYPAGMPSSVSYMIGAHLGGNCVEPWKVTGSAESVTTEGGTSLIRANAYDWQDADMMCYADWSSLGGFDQEMHMVSEGDGMRGFTLHIDIPGGLEPGDYPIILRAEHIYPKENKIYNIIYATVQKELAPINLSNDDRLNQQLNFTSKTVAAWSDKIYVVWSEDYTGNGRTEIVMKEFDGEEWLEPVLVSMESTDESIWANPSIAVNQANGDIHVIWEGHDGQDMALGYNKRVNGIWQTPHVLFNGAFCMDSQITVENSGKVHIVLHDADGPFFTIFWLHDPGTGVFNEPFILAQDPTNPMNPFYAPAIAHDHAGWVHVTYTSGFGGDNNIGYRRYNGTSWTSPMFITGDFDSMWQALAVAPNRKTTMVYRKNSLQDFVMKEWTGTWEPGEHRVTDGAEIYGVPNIHSDSQGNIHLAYVGTFEGQREIYYQVKPADTTQWSDPVNISNTETDSQNPALFVGPDDTVHIVYQEKVNDIWDVFYVEI